MKKYNKYISAASARILSVASQFLLLAVISRVADLGSTGIYGACFSIASIVAIVGGFGQVASAFREIPGLRAQGDHVGIAAVVNKAIALAFGGMAVVSVLMIVVAQFVGWSAEIVVLCFVLSVGICFLNVYSAIARSFGWVFISEFSKNGVWRLCAAFALLGVWSWAGGAALTTEYIIRVTAISCFGAMLWCLADFFNREKVVPQLPSAHQVLTGFRVDTQSWLIQVMQAALLNLDVVIAGMVLSPSTLGAYFIITRLASLVALPLSITNPVIIPVISRFAKGEANARSQERVVFNTGLNIGGSLLLFFAIACIFKILYPLLSNDESTDQLFIVFLLLGLTQLTNTVVGPSTMACQLFKVRSTSLRFISLAVLSQIVLIVLLGGKFGLIGVAMALFVSRGLLNAGIYTLILRKGRFNLITGVLRSEGAG